MSGKGEALRRPVPAKSVAIVQSSYIPWKGYFDLMRRVDEFILFDDVQFTRRDWRNRNRIKTPQGACWLTIPVEVKGRHRQAIKETRIADPSWRVRHWRSVRTHYARAPYFREYADVLEDLFLGSTSSYLSEVNYRTLLMLRDLLSIRTPLTWSMQYDVVEGRTERLLSLCRQAGATEYLSGPSARQYIEGAAFETAGIGLRFMDYTGYPEYPQLHPPFDHHVSVIDLLVHTGPSAPAYLLPL